jgi:hypothetical protein
MKITHTHTHTTLRMADPVKQRRGVTGHGRPDHKDGVDIVGMSVFECVLFFFFFHLCSFFISPCFG